MSNSTDCIYLSFSSPPPPAASVEVDIFAENPEYLDELIAWSGAFFLKSSHHRMVYVELEATFTKGMISGSFLLTHYSYNVWVYYLTYVYTHFKFQISWVDLYLSSL